MLMIRMARFGAKKKPTYRVVLIEKRSGRDSAALEVLGHYNPVAQPTVVSLQHDRIQHWVKRGAQMSDTVKRLVAKNPPAAEQPAA
jgi:small subunit ribosomal protein S16